VRVVFSPVLQASAACGPERLWRSGVREHRLGGLLLSDAKSNTIYLLRSPGEASPAASGGAGVGASGVGAGGSVTV
jgi:hypothetical protein